MSSYRRYYLPRVSWSDVKGGVWRIQPYNVTDYFFIFRVQNLLTSAACFSMASGWGFFPIPSLFPQPACFSYASGWGFFPIPPIFPQPARKQACSDACAWGIITQKSPRAMWSSAGLLEKGVDYKFHVREFMFRCG